MWCANNPRRAAALLAGTVLAAGFAVSAAAATVYDQVIPRTAWPQRANGATVAALPVIRRTLRRFDETEKVNILIRHPGGDAGIKWARQVHGWLVSFGIPSRYLELQPGAGGNGQLVISLIDRRD